MFWWKRMSVLRHFYNWGDFFSFVVILNICCPFCHVTKPWQMFSFYWRTLMISNQKLLVCMFHSLT